MARIANVNIPNDKRFVIALTYVYGIGNSRAQKICEELKIDQNIRTKDVSEDVLSQVRDLIKQQADVETQDDSSGEVGLVEGDLRRKVISNIKRLKDLGCYRGIRHIKKLPVRGQRTHTNARTRKGKAVAIAGKKK